MGIDFDFALDLVLRVGLCLFCFEKAVSSSFLIFLHINRKQTKIAVFALSRFDHK